MVRQEIGITEASKILKVARSTVIRWIKTGKIKSHNTPGGANRINRNDFIDFMNKRGTPIERLYGIDKRRILIIDNDENILNQLSGALSKNENEVKTATDIFTAGFITHKFKPQIILIHTDIKEGNPREVIDTLKEHREFKNVRIFAVAQKPDENLKKQGFHGCLSMPIDPDKLQEEIE